MPAGVCGNRGQGRRRGRADALCFGPVAGRPDIGPTGDRSPGRLDHRQLGRVSPVPRLLLFGALSCRSPLPSSASQLKPAWQEWRGLRGGRPRALALPCFTAVWYLCRSADHAEAARIAQVVIAGALPPCPRATPSLPNPHVLPAESRGGGKGECRVHGVGERCKVTALALLAGASCYHAPDAAKIPSGQTSNVGGRQALAPAPVRKDRQRGRE